jgi:hypothetical protein
LRGEVGAPRSGYWYANFPACRSFRRKCVTARLSCGGKIGIVFS